jgi:hypothetical protein
LFRQYKKCHKDDSEQAKKIKRYHDADMVRAFEKISAQAVTVSILGSSSTSECDSAWGDAVRMGHALKKLGFNVWQGGGRGIMGGVLTACDIPDDASPEVVDDIIDLQCEAKPASSERLQEIETTVKSHISSGHNASELGRCISVHGMPWLGRLEVMPYIGFGDLRAELSSIYMVLEIMVALADITIDFEAYHSAGTNLESAAMDAQITYNLYLNPGKDQKAIHYGPTGINPEKLAQPNVQCASTVEQVVDHVKTFVREKICAKDSSLRGCSAVLYSQPVTAMQAGMAQQVAPDL